jgi:D-hydroxyproline dehydrogenase subunit gamma
MSMASGVVGGRLIRLAETDRAPMRFFLDGTMYRGLAGDTVLSAILSVSPMLRRSEFGPEARAGFCLMGACQDCWVWQEDGPRLRACSTPLAEGMRLLTDAPRDWP